MAQDVALWGVAYTDVPEVRVPKQGGGMAAFHDVSDTTAQAADVAQGKLFHAADGTLTTGTASGGGGGDESLAALINRSVSSPTFPAGLTKIGDYAFARCYSLSGEVVLPQTITQVGECAFSDCTAITSLRSDAAITNFGTRAFLGTISSINMGLRSVRLPNLAVVNLTTVFGGSGSSYPACKYLEVADLGNVRTLKSNCLYNCNRLSTIVLRRSDAICALENVSALTNTPMRGYNGLTGTIYVPQALIETYKTANNWKTIYNEGHLTFAAIEGSPYELT